MMMPMMTMMTMKRMLMICAGPARDGLTLVRIIASCSPTPKIRQRERRKNSAGAGLDCFQEWLF